MKFDQLIVLLPCLSLEDFTLRRNSDESEQLLSGWSALWHPALIHSAQTVPSWAPAEEPPSDPSGHLIMVPDCSADLLPDGWLDRANTAGGCVLQGLRDRHRAVMAILDRLHGDPEPVDPVSVDEEIAADFLALGYCHFMVELLTRQLRYMSNLDEESFKSALLQAAEHAAARGPEDTKAQLQSAFDLLNEAREYFYPVEAHLLDLTLVAETTLGEALRKELASQLPTNLLISGETLQQMAQREPATLEALTNALEQNKAAIVGGEYDERALPLLTPEAMLYHFRRGMDVHQELLGRRPTIFGRRRFGLSPVLPGILKQLGFQGAVHCTLDDGKFPTGTQSRIQWEGIDSTLIETLGRVPFDASRSDAFLRLPERLGDSMDLDHVATVVLAHWPGQSSPWYRDVRRIAGYSQVLGTFATITDYFEETGFSGQQTQYKADQYRSPYLRQAVTAGRADPISRWVRYHGRRARVDELRSLEMLVACGAGIAQPSTLSADELVRAVEDSAVAGVDPAEELDRRLQTATDDAVRRFAESLCGQGRTDESGYLVVNPWSFSRRVLVETPDLAESPPVAGPVLAAGESRGKRAAVVDLPAMGFAWVGPGQETAADPMPPKPKKEGRVRLRKRKEEPPLAEENVLRNEFCRVTFDPSTGAIRSIGDYRSRGARLAQQIALRTPRAGEADPGDDSHYSIMVADEIRVTSPGPLLGEIVCRGRLVDREARRLAGFTQTTRVRRGSRVIEIAIELAPQQQPTRDPWNSYYAARFAWGDATANVYRSVSLANLPTDCVQVEAPHFVDVRAGDIRTTLLTGGLPYHRRFGLRKLDTLLAVCGETARSFRFGVGIDVPHPVSAALDFLCPPTVVPAVPAPPTPSGWLFHLDSRNVLATYWEPLLSDGHVTGFRVRLLETDGRKVQLGLRSFRAVRSARKLNPGDTLPTDLAVEDDRITVPLGPHEWVEVEAEFIL